MIDLAQLCGWMVAHFRPAQTKHGWRTPVQADGKGYPDLTLVRDRLIMVELKADAGRLSPDQKRWIEALEAADVEVYVWRPKDFDWVLKTLR